MNILRLITYSTDVKLTPSQLKECTDSECFAYVNPNAIGVTTCGTKIQTDNVFPQKKTENVSFVLYSNSPIAEVHGEIDNQEVIALSSRELIERQKLYTGCKKVTSQGEGTLVYKDCKHVKFVVKNEDIIIAQ